MVAVIFFYKSLVAIGPGGCMWVNKGTDGGKRHLLNRWEGVFPKNISQQYLLFCFFCNVILSFVYLSSL